MAPPAAGEGGSVAPALAKARKREKKTNENCGNGDDNSRRVLLKSKNCSQQTRVLWSSTFVES